MRNMNSQKMFIEASEILVGGVNSPVRAFRGVGGDPFFVKAGKGAQIWDVDGNTYIDYVMSWGPLLFGHASSKIVRAVKKSAIHGTSFGIPTENETYLAKLIQKAFPAMEKIRLVSSGTEATMSAIRLARGYTGKDLIIKFDGGYHGHGDSLLVQAGSGVATLSQPDSAGVPADFAKHTLSLPYNQIEAVKAAFQSHVGEIAGVIIEPVAGNMGCVTPLDGYLQELRELCTQYGVVLILDEVMTGFRVAWGGAQQRYGIAPDITTLGKIVGGGMPLAAYGGKKEIMDKVAPLGSVYQAGTLSGNPISVAAGIAMLKMASDPQVYRKLEYKTQFLGKSILELAAKSHIPVTLNRVGSMFTLFFHEGPVTDYASAKKSDTARYAKFFHAMLEEGIYLAPSQFECGFVSLAHHYHCLEKTIQAAERVFKTL